ncbi:hypothetical protein IAR55_002964 [Kwoniella newhampshirensis]|uniref:PX domain-containing protein n=1 Tax=Kwoniella newhampshirensis TaxID=1651941 RepID=A0AAW0Z035_9TREE
MDEEASFANLLSSTIAPARPSWNSGGTNPEEHDPWANPFSDVGGGSSTANFTHPITGALGLNDSSSSTYLPTFPTTATTASTTSTSSTTGGFGDTPDSPREETTTSPYVRQIERERVAEASTRLVPDPPSVIAAREQGAGQEGFGYASSAFGTPTLRSVAGGGEEDPFATAAAAAAAAATTNPFAPTTSDPANIPFAVPPTPTPLSPPPSRSKSTKTQSTNSAPTALPSRRLPASLIDEDLLAESDPEQSLKKAFKKSTPAPALTRSGSGTASPSGSRKAYVFTPGKKGGNKKEEVKHKADEEKKDEGREKAAEMENKVADAKDVASGEKEDVQEKKENSKDAEKPETLKEDEQKMDNAMEGTSITEPPKEMEVEQDPPDAVAKDGKAEVKADVPSDAEAGAGETVENKTTETVTNGDEAKAVEATISHQIDSADGHDVPTPTATTPTGLQSPISVPLPNSSNATPTISRIPSPLPLAKPQPEEPGSSSILATPSTDRVSVSPLEAPTEPETDYSFKSLSIGGSSTSLPPPLPTKDSWSGNGNKGTNSPPSSRFGGKGWGVLEDDQDGDGGLFGKGGPSIKSDPWGGDVTSNGPGGWGEPDLASLPPSAGPSRHFESDGGDEDDSSFASPAPSNTTTRSPTNGFAPLSPSSETPTTPSRRNKLSSTPLFQITVSDPHRMGDAVRGYTVYTVRTRTTSPHYRKGDFSVLRRFSDFLWLYDVLSLNNPGVIVPPVPDKHAFGRFQDQFIETRRSALERCMAKIISHPVLQLDPDLRMFLESDSFALDAKSRKQEAAALEKQQLQQQQGLLAGWTGGPKFVEQDDWFDSRRAFLDSLESQLKSLSKSIDLASKHRLELSLSISEYSETILALSESDLGTSLSSALAQLASLAEKEKENQEESAKADVVQLLNMADEYVRFIASVRVAFSGRVKVWGQWQNQEKEVTRLRMIRERMRQQGRLGEKVQSSMIEIADAERKARELAGEFDRLTKLVKFEFVRFERERVDEFKSTLEKYLDGLMGRERALIESWEGFHRVLAGVVEKSQGVGGNGNTG